MIGVFDSGLGGLTVLKKMVRSLPEYDFCYLGDSARAPYGSKSEDVIFGYVKQAADFLFEKGCTLIILACNTASAKALRRVQQEYLPDKHPDKRVLGVIIPAAQKTAEIIINGKKANLNKVGIVGTRSTINSGAYDAELAKALGRPDGGKKPAVRVFSQACPLLVPLIEEGWASKPETKIILKKYLNRLKQKQINLLILGCTHYPLLQYQISRIMGKNVRIVSTPEAVAEKTREYLETHPEIAGGVSKNRKMIFFTTDDEARFKSQAQKFMGGRIKRVSKANI